MRPRAAAVPDSLGIVSARRAIGAQSPPEVWLQTLSIGIPPTDKNVCATGDPGIPAGARAIGDNRPYLIEPRGLPASRFPIERGRRGRPRQSGLRSTGVILPRFRNSGPGHDL